MKDAYRFTIAGNPVRVYKATYNAHCMRDTYAENQCRCRIDLERQYDEPLISQPIAIKYIFYLPNSCKYRPHKVSIIELFRFANHIAAGIIYTKECLLYDVELVKRYSSNPHTEIYINTIKDYKKGPYGYANQKRYKKRTKKQ